MDRPTQVTARHLARLAIAYVRQSTDAQVENHRGSTSYQRSQARFAKQWGWPDGSVRIIEDLGLSGMTTDRPGYQEILTLLRSGQVGALFFADFTRGGREAIAWFILLDECAMHDVLIVIDGRVYDMRNDMDLLLAQVNTVVGGHENRTRTANMRRSRLQRAKDGKAVSRPPVGYWAGDERGEWKLDPDPRIQEFVRSVFRGYLLNRSVRRTLIWLKEQKAVFLFRGKKGDIKEGKLHESTITSMLHNVAYLGSYAFGKTRAAKELKRDHHKVFPRRQTAESEQIVTPNHHPAYVSKEEWQQIQNLLHKNARSAEHSNLGPSDKLLQGLCRCELPGEQHRGVLRVAPGWKRRKTDGISVWYYYCDGHYDAGGRKCVFVPGAELDRIARDAVLARLAPPGVEMLRQAVGRAREDQAAQRQQHERRLNDARQKVSDLKYRYYSNVDAGNRLLACEVERDLEAASQFVKDLDALSHAGSMADFDEAVLDELVALQSDLLRLFEAPTTENHDRKLLVRTLIRRVVITEADEYSVSGRIEWVDRWPSTSFQVHRSTWGHKLMWELAATGMSPKDIAVRLESMGVRTSQGNSWSPSAIAARLYLMRKKAIPGSFGTLRG